MHLQNKKGGSRVFTDKNKPQIKTSDKSTWLVLTFFLCLYEWLKIVNVTTKHSAMVHPFTPGFSRLTTITAAAKTSTRTGSDLQCRVIASTEESNGMRARKNTVLNPEQERSDVKTAMMHLRIVLRDIYDKYI